MIKAKFHNGECYINAKGNTISLVAELMASPAMMANILFERLELPKETEKEIVKEIIKDLEEKFL